MYPRSIVLGTAFAATLFAGAIAAGPWTASEARADACLPTDIIDGSTAGHAAMVMRDAGYMQPHDLNKGCDNYWYGRAIKDGTPVDVVLPPGGAPFTTHNS